MTLDCSFDSAIKSHFCSLLISNIFCDPRFHFIFAPYLSTHSKYNNFFLRRKPYILGITVYKTNCWNFGI